MTKTQFFCIFLDYKLTTTAKPNGWFLKRGNQIIALRYSTAVVSRLSSTALLLLIHLSYSITSRRQADRVKETALEQTTTAAFDGTATITASSFIFRQLVLYSFVRWCVSMMAFSFNRYNSSSSSQFPIIRHSKKSLFPFERVAIMMIPFPLHTLIHHTIFLFHQAQTPINLTTNTRLDEN